MKQYLISIWNAIKNGILSIFPLPQKAGVIGYVIIGLTLIGCAAPKQVTQVVRDIQRDTVYLSNVQYDSIYVYLERFQDRTQDTTYLKDVSIEYRYKMLRDTIYKVQHDSIPYEVTKIVTKEIQRPPTIFDRLCRICFFFLMGALFVLFVRFVVKLKKSIYG